MAAPRASALVWSALAPREQKLVLLAATGVALALLWFVLLRPALGVLRSAEAQTAALDADAQTLQALRARALALQKLPVYSAQERLADIRNSLPPLGAGAHLQSQGNQVVVTLQDVPAAALGNWLVQAGASLHPAQVHLTRSGEAGAARWSGTLSFVLPASGS